MTDQRSRGDLPTRRWDNDERGRGVADATAFVSSIEELAGLARVPDWVAEDPEAHLLPHLERAIDDRPGVILLGHRTHGGVLEADVAFAPSAAAGTTQRAAREVAIDLVAAIAETLTFVRERQEVGATIFEVVTGAAEGDGPFATHGHTVRLRVRASRPEQPG